MDDSVRAFEEAMGSHGRRLLPALRAVPFAGMPTFAGAPHTRDLSAADAVVMGVPFDSGTSYRPGTRHGPRAIREHSRYAASLQPVYPWSYDLRQALRVIDWGDVAVVPGSQAVELMIAAATEAAGQVLGTGASLLTVGGDHTVTYGPVRAAARSFGPLALVHLDAHQDSYDPASVPELQVVSHGSFATELANEGLIDLERSAQIYVRTNMQPTPGGGYTIIDAVEAADLGPGRLAARIRELTHGAPVYLTLDVDALDPAFAPGTGTPVPGGPSTAELRRLLHGLEGIDVVAADIVEVNPLLDPAQATAVTAAYLSLDLLYLLCNARRGEGVAARACVGTPAREGDGATAGPARATNRIAPVEERKAADWPTLEAPEDVPTRPVLFRRAAARWPVWYELQPARLSEPPWADQVVAVKGCRSGHRRKLALGELLADDAGGAQDPWYVVDWAVSAAPVDVLARCELPRGVENWLDELSARADWAWLFIGEDGSFTELHVDVLHSSAWNVVFAGRKHWRCVAPDDAGEVSCVQEAGDIILMPPGWLHEVANEGLTVALTGNFVNASNVGEALAHCDPTWAAVIRRLQRQFAAVQR